MSRAVPATRAVLRSAFAEAAAKPGRPLARRCAMIVNDFVWVVFWVLFFDRVGTLRGWDRDRILLLLAVLTTAGGLVLGLLANARRIGDAGRRRRPRRRPGAAGLAAAAPAAPPHRDRQPRRPRLRHGPLRRRGAPDAAAHARLRAGTLASATLLTGFLVLTGSLAFFIGRSESGELGFHAMLLLGAYPVDVFAGAAKVLLYTVVPAAFVGGVPAQLVDDFDLGPPPCCSVSPGSSPFLGWGTFTAGLRRYASGSAWGRG